MNPMDRLLQDEMNRLVDRLAASAPEGLAQAVLDRHPELRDRIETAETRMSALRLSMLEGYRQWQSALTEYEDLWALSALKSLEATERAQPIAA